MLAAQRRQARQVALLDQLQRSTTAGRNVVHPVGQAELAEGDVITLDGGNGQVMRGLVPTIEPELAGDFGVIMEWADEARRMGVRTNAETPEDCKTARSFGAEGIGLCRTEHMFFEADRLTVMREMIFAESSEDRRAALDLLLPPRCLACGVTVPTPGAVCAGCWRGCGPRFMRRAPSRWPAAWRWTWRGPPGRRTGRRARRF